MPLYEYACGACGAATELLRKFDERDHAVACQCGGGMERRMSAPAIRVSGKKAYRHPYGRNIARGYRTPAQQEAVYSRIVKHERKVAEEVRAKRRNTRRQDGEMRKIGVVPREKWEQEIQRSGNRTVWTEGGKKMLAEQDLLFPS